MPKRRHEKKRRSERRGQKAPPHLIETGLRGRGLFSLELNQNADKAKYGTSESIHHIGETLLSRERRPRRPEGQGRLSR
jgi:hypothetical protein